MSATDSTRAKLDMGRVFSDTLAVARRQAPLLFGLSFVLQFLPALVNGFLSVNIMRSRPGDASALFSSPVYPFTGLAGGLLGAFVLSCQLYLAISDLEGRSPALQETLRQSVAKFLPLLGTMILLALGVVFGFVLFIVPGVILAIMWSVALPAVVGETSNVFDAFSRSNALTRGNRWRIFGLSVLVWFVAIVVEGVVLAVVRIVSSATGPSAVTVVVSALLNFILSILLSVGSGALYIQLRELKGAGGESVAQVFA